MKSGELKHRIKLQSKSVTRGTYGEETIVWTEESQVWAEIKPLSGREYFLAKQVQSEMTHRIRIRYYSGVRTDWRVLFGSRIFEILAIINPDEANQELILNCKEFVT